MRPRITLYSPVGRGVERLRPSGHVSYSEDQDPETMDLDPYCQCGEDPIEEELASNTCFACGRPLE